MQHLRLWKIRPCNTSATGRIKRFKLCVLWFISRYHEAFFPHLRSYVYWVLQHHLLIAPSYLAISCPGPTCFEFPRHTSFLQTDIWFPTHRASPESQIHFFCHGGRFRLNARTHGDQTAGFCRVCVCVSERAALSQWMQGEMAIVLNCGGLWGLLGSGTAKG